MKFKIHSPSSPEAQATKPSPLAVNSHWFRVYLKYYLLYFLVIGYVRLNIILTVKEVHGQGAWTVQMETSSMAHPFEGVQETDISLD